MLATLALIAVLSIVTTWFATTLDDLRYGRPRTFQVDAYVGHNESQGMPSHFLAVNLHGRIEIIELPGVAASHARIYIGPQLYGADADLIPVTLSFIDVNSDHKPDMVITFQGTQVVFINDQGGFRPLSPAEREGLSASCSGWGHHGEKRGHLCHCKIPTYKGSGKAYVLQSLV